MVKRYNVYNICINIVYLLIVSIYRLNIIPRGSILLSIFNIAIINAIVSMSWGTLKVALGLYWKIEENLLEWNLDLAVTKVPREVISLMRFSYRTN